MKLSIDGTRVGFECPDDETALRVVRLVLDTLQPAAPAVASPSRDAPARTIVVPEPEPGLYDPKLTIEQAVLKVVADTSGLTKSQIVERLPHAKRTTVVRAIARMTEWRRLVVSGLGMKSSPYRYHLPATRVAANGAHDSRPVAEAA